MNTKLTLFALFAAFYIPAAAPADDRVAETGDQIAGTWKLVSIEEPQTPNAASTTRKPSGIIIYDNTGHMTAQMVRVERPQFAGGAGNATEQERAQAYSTYLAYHGTYTVDPVHHIVINHIEGSLNPNQIGQETHRYFEVKGNQLILTLADDGKGGILAFKDTKQHLIWEKLPTK